MQQSITDKDRKRAEYCLNECSGCKKARREQKGLAFWVVKFVERGFCPNCKAYAKIYGRKVTSPLRNSFEKAFTPYVRPI